MNVRQTFKIPTSSSCNSQFNILAWHNRYNGHPNMGDRVCPDIQQDFLDICLHNSYSDCFSILDNEERQIRSNCNIPLICDTSKVWFTGPFFLHPKERHSRINASFIRTHNHWRGSEVYEFGDCNIRFINSFSCYWNPNHVLHSEMVEEGVI